MTFEEAVAYLDQHINLEKMVAGTRAATPTFERIRALVDLMAEPQKQYAVIHLTGTNGKTSTARMVTALLGASGLSVGTYTSPHLERINERLSWNGEAISDGAFAEVIEAVAALEPMLQERPTYFEVLTAGAFRWFADVAVDAAVVEVGLGGRWDATNVADGRVAVATNVGLDHAGFLGPTREDIAREKSGIVKPGSTLILGETTPELAAIFRAAGAAEVWEREQDFGCVVNRVAHGGRLLDLRTPGATYDDVYLPLHGAHQGDNAACAVAAVEAFFGRPLDPSVVEDALARVQSPGRLEVVGRRPLVVLDGVKNPEAARAAAATLNEEFAAAASRIIVLGMLKGRAPEEMLDALEVKRARLLVACAPDSPRAVPPDELAAAARAMGVETVVAPSVAAAVERAIAAADPEDLVLVTGSLYVVGEARPVVT